MRWLEDGLLARLPRVRVLLTFHDVVARATTSATALTRSQWIPQLLVRLFLGYFFFETGWSKVGNLDAMAERFTGWGIPFPGFNAALSGYTELIGGRADHAGAGDPAGGDPALHQHGGGDPRGERQEGERAR